MEYSLFFDVFKISQKILERRPIVTEKNGRWNEIVISKNAI